MLVSQFQEVRRFLGRLDAGQDLVAGLKTVCRENGVSSGWLQVSAVLRTPSVARLKDDGNGFQAADVLDGVIFCPAIQGNVSLRQDALDLRLYAACHPADGSPSALGVLRAGEVVHCEFLLVACDDAALVREDGNGAGYAPWVQLQAGHIPAAEPLRAAPAASATAPATAPEAPGGTRAGAGRKAGTAAPAPAPAAAPSASSFVPPPLPPLRQAPDEDEASELNALEMSVGDYVDHPRFGKCRIVHAPHDEKVTVRLETGKHVDLSLGVMRVLPPRMQGARKVFQVEMRRRG
jgi:hypothetical protein